MFTTPVAAALIGALVGVPFGLAFARVVFRFFPDPRPPRGGPGFFDRR